MASWGDVLVELGRTTLPNGAPDFDTVRRKYLQELHELTGNSTIIYAADFLGDGGPGTQINLADMMGLMETFKGLPGPNLDLILHSPGGQAEATDRIVRYMRSRFDYVRVFVPLAAMSAATMWAMAADEIVMGKHSQLGPIDPQVTIPGGFPVPAGALIDQFKDAVEECSQHPERITGWLPTLQQYPPGLLNVCESAAKLAEQLVEEWLSTYMLRGKPDEARACAKWLADDKTHLSHGRAITRDQLQDRGLNVTNLEDDQSLQEAVLSVHHVVMHTFSGSAIKLIENNLNRAYVQHGGVVVGAHPAPAPPQPPVPNPPRLPGQNGPRPPNHRKRR